MPQPEVTYTYRAGERILLEKQPDQFVVRALPEQLREIGIVDAEKVSASSSRVTTRAADLEPMMSRTRHLAPTHHAYYAADTKEEFLVTDRILVTFRQPLPDAEVDAFAGRYGLVKKAAYGDRDYLFQLTDHTGMNPVKLVVTLTENEPAIEAAEHDLNHRMHVSIHGAFRSGVCARVAFAHPAQPRGCRSAILLSLRGGLAATIRPGSSARSRRRKRARCGTSR